MKKRITFKTWIFILISSLCLAVLTISLINIFYWTKDSLNTKKIVKEINNNIEIETKEDNEKTEIINKPLDTNNDYWYYITFPFIEVNINELKKKNNDTIGWINVNNTNINYPIVQTNDNEYYLNHSYNKKVNNAGWIFLDYRNNNNFTDKNNIIYGHSRVDKTMFATLLDTLNYNWYSNKDNHIIRLSLEKENYLYQIFSVYKIPTESYYITTKFSNDKEYQEFIDTIKKRSIYDFNTDINIKDNILTLSTCYDDDNRTVVHAKLIKKQEKNN